MLWPKVIGEALALFEKPDGISSVRPAGKHDALYFILDAPVSQLYTENWMALLTQILAKAGESAVVHENSVEFLNLQLAALDERGRFCSRETRIEFIKNHTDLMTAIWQAATARPYQYRFLDGLRQNREKLMSLKVPGLELPNPPWLSYQYEGS